MSVSVAHLDIAREPSADAKAGGTALLEPLPTRSSNSGANQQDPDQLLRFGSISRSQRTASVRITAWCEPVQDHDQLSRFRWEASCSSGSRPSLGALGIRWRLLRHSVAIADGPAQI